MLWQRIIHTCHCKSVCCLTRFTPSALNTSRAESPLIPQLSSGRSCWLTELILSTLGSPCYREMCSTPKHSCQQAMESSTLVSQLSFFYSVPPQWQISPLPPAIYHTLYSSGSQNVGPGLATSVCSPGSCCSFLGLAPQTDKNSGWGPAAYVAMGHPGDSDALLILRTIV